MRRTYIQYSQTSSPISNEEIGIKIKEYLRTELVANLRSIQQIITNIPEYTIRRIIKKWLKKVS